MSPILVRPVREQLEHDRVIRLLQAKYKRKFEVAVNLGNEQSAPVGPSATPWYPDLVLQSQEKSRRLAGVIEVETTESVNNLEAMSQWVAFSNLKTLFYLYVPAGSVDSARRLSTDLGLSIAELWAYQAVGEQIRFALIHRDPQAEANVRVEKVEKAGKPDKTAKRVEAVEKPGKVEKTAAKSVEKVAAKPNGKVAVPARTKAAKAPARTVRRPAAKTVSRSATSARTAKATRSARTTKSTSGRSARKPAAKPTRASKRR